MDNYTILSDDRHGTFAERLGQLGCHVSHFLQSEQQLGRKAQYAKIFLTDAANQQAELLDSRLMTEWLHGVAVTIIQQPPTNGAKIVVLLKTSNREPRFLLSPLRLTDQETLGLGAYTQTVMLFDKYLAQLREQHLKLDTHCLRTWIYVRDIDTNYDGVVKARNDIFRQYGLTAETHFIASTGIGGRTASRNAHVAIDFLTYPDVSESDKTYLQALDHLNPTHEYGVAFERATRLRQADGDVFFISGTASIDHRGEVVHVGDVERQTERLLENIGALLAAGGASMDCVRYFIIYIRDIADAPIVEAYMQRHYPTKPRVVTLAKVCRPAWLVEMECVATKECSYS